MTIQRNWQELIQADQAGDCFSGTTTRAWPRLSREPLERGYGLTLGNALRRVLLSSLQGAAVTAIQIDGILHEFSSLPGVREDITDLVLNVKEIALKMGGEGPKRLTLSRQGPGAVTAGDIKVTGDIEVLNPELVICHSRRRRRDQYRVHRRHRQGLCRRRQEPSGRCADRLYPGRLPVLAGAPRQLQGRCHPARRRASTRTS